MNKQKLKVIKKIRRKAKIRTQISGTALRPRLSVFKSNTSVFLQLIDDTIGKTIVSAHSKEIKDGKDVDVEFETGKLLARKALEKKVESVVFDRGGNKYHGRVKSVGEGAREGGLKF